MNIHLQNDPHDHPIYQSSRVPRKRKIIFDAETETKKILDDLLAASRKTTNVDALAQLQTLRKNRQDRVYANLKQSNADYLMIILKERSSKIDKDSQIIEKIINKREKGVLKDIKSQKIEINQSHKSLEAIKNELEQSLQVMRIKNPEKHIPPQYYSQSKKIQELKELNHLQFRRKSYWKVPNQRHQSAMQMISKIRKEQIKAKQIYERALSTSIKRKQDQQQRKIKQKQQKQKKYKEILHQRYKEYKLQRQKQIKAQAQKQRQVQEILQKYKTKPPAHVIFQQNEKKMNQIQQMRMKHALSQIKQKKRRYRLSQINQSLQSYQQIKQKRAQQFQQKRLFDLQSQQQIKQRLNKLYKSKIRSSTAELQVETPDHKKIKHEKLMKMLMYSQQVKQSHPPKVDQAKKQQLLQSIKQAAQHQHKIKKIKNGQLILLDKNDFDRRQIGLHYLQQVKQMTSLIQRKPPKPPSPKEYKLVDKSKMKKLSKTKKITISNWKAIIEGQKLTQEQKQQKLQSYFQLIQQEKNKANKNRKRLSLSKSIQIQKKIDHYQVEKAAAKLALLKSML